MLKVKGGKLKSILLLTFPHFENYYPKTEKTDMKTYHLKEYGLLALIGIGIIAVVAILLGLVQIYLWAAYDIGLPI